MELELGGIAVSTQVLSLPYSTTCKFNYLFVHVSSLQASRHNLNGNREPIYLAADSNSSAVQVCCEDTPQKHFLHYLTGCLTS